MNEQAHTTEETIRGEETNNQINQNSNAEQTTSETSGSTSGQEEHGEVNQFQGFYDMLTERDKTIADLKKEVTELKKTNTNLLLKVNASANGGEVKDPYKAFIDAMVKR